MKYRTCYISNSSTLSYVCVVCQEIESERDASLNDFCMYSCENGHVFHAGCMGLKDYPDWTFEQNAFIIALERLYENQTHSDNPYYSKESLDLLLNIISYMKENPQQDLDDIAEEFHLYDVDVPLSYDNLECVYEECVYELPAQICPICQFTIIDPNDLMRYSIKEYGGKDQLLSVIRERFISYHEFKQYITN